MFNIVGLRHLYQHDLMFTIVGLRHLKQLDLGHNDIASMWLKGQVFQHLNHLTHLNLSNNRDTEN